MATATKQLTGSKDEVRKAIAATEQIWFVEGWTSATKTHRIGQGYVVASSAEAAKAVCNGDIAKGRKLFGDFGFGAGHIKTASKQHPESIRKALQL